MHNFSFYRVLFVLIVLLLRLSTGISQQDSLAQYLADRADSLDNKDALLFLDEAFKLCENEGCADSTIARLHQLKSVIYYYEFYDYKALKHADSAYLFFKQGFTEISNCNIL